VYGDIGTSPLYALRECFTGSHPITLTPDNVLGVLSLILWSLVLVISVKYLIFVTRADNRGEGGIMALLALVHPRQPTQRGGRRWLLITLGLFGASLLYGDSMITPAISVLSAIEGLEIATPVFTPYVVPVTLGIEGETMVEVTDGLAQDHSVVIDASGMTEGMALTPVDGTEDTDGKPGS